MKHTNKQKARAPKELIEARDVLLRCASMPPGGSIADGIRLLAKCSRDQALNEAARAVCWELRKFWPMDVHAENVILALRLTT